MKNAKTLIATTAACALALGLSATATLAQNVINSNTTIHNSLCVGSDCASSETYGFDTVRLKENNTRLNFDDTSNSGSFPRNDWTIVANDSANGGASYLAIEDSTAGRKPFLVEAGARWNALVVDSSSRVGFGTASPVVSLHTVLGNTPTLRLEQDGSSGFAPQTWDVAGNETSFFIRDATGGSTLPFRIMGGGAPSQSLVIDSDGEVGIGAGTNPRADLHVLDSGSAFSANADTVALFQSNTNTTDVARITILSGNAGNGQLAFGDADNEFAGRIRYFHSDNQMDFILNGSLEVLSMFSSGANVLETATSSAVLTSAGVWQDASSRALKQNITDLSLNDAMSALEGLQPVTFNYIKEPDETTVGFIAEDVPDLVATASRKTLSSLDIVAVLTKVVKNQKEVIDGLGDRLELLENAE